ncbi:MAG: SGNH/GDSL hydrolase family protein [Actinomycetota bacterium]
MTENTETPRAASDPMIKRPPRRKSAVGAFLISSTALYLSQRSTPIWLQLLLIFIGAVALAATLQLTSTLIEKDRKRWVWLFLGGGLVALVLGAVIFQMGWIAAPGLLAVMLGLVLIHDDAAGELRPWLAAVGFVLLATSVVTLSTASIAWRVIGVLVWIVGVVVFKMGVVHHIRAAGADQAPRRSRRVVDAAAVALAVGVFVLLASMFGWTDWGSFGWILSFTVLFAALSALGLASADVWRPSTHRNRAAVIAGAIAVVAFVIAFVLIRASLPNFTTLAFVLLLVPATVAAFFVLRGEAIAGLALLGLLLIWVLADRTENPPEPADDATGVLLALGDSFTSGQGTDRYRANTNTEDPEGNSCRRSPVAYSELIARALNLQAASYACNGAQTADVRGLPANSMASETDFAPRQVDPQLTVPDGKSQLANIVDGSGVLADLSERFDIDDVELVLLSLGGNDAEFSTVVAACLLPTDCSTLEPQWMATVSLIGSRLQNTYAEIRQVVGPNVPIVVMPYPDYIPQSGCDASLSDEEKAFARRFIAAINLEANHLTASEDQLFWFGDMDAAYRNRSMCSDEAAANLFRFVPKEGNIIERLTPTNWHEATAHPNDLGHRCTAAAFLASSDLAAELGLEIVGDRVPDCELRATSGVEIPGLAPDEHPGSPDERERATGPLATSGDDGDKPCPARPLGADGTREPGCFNGDDWTTTQLIETAKRLIWPVALSILGGLAGALTLLWAWPLLREKRGMGIVSALIPESASEWYERVTAAPRSEARQASTSRN